MTTLTITETEAAVLALIDENAGSYGFDIVKRSNGEIKLGSIYVLLQRLTKKGFVTSEKLFDGQTARRVYRTTPAGLRHKHARSAYLAALA